ncbi:MAG: SprT-like domain-containing protein [Proteobacteria bacterium]|nr:SprT-like domain-containing protein [Pseudomonadota bacterium]
MTVNLRIDQLQALWLQQLQHEHEDICISHNVLLPTPIFEISDSQKIYGCWQAATGILSLSRHLILQHSWSVTLEVLKHEMAHQLCSVSLQVGNRAHGELFQKACERLGVLPEFRRPGVVVKDLVHEAAARSELSESGRRCLAKIEKLLALGRSANEHEAALAMEKANALLEKYHLHGLGEGGEHRYACVIIDRKKKKIASYQRHICSILQEFFFVRIVLSQLYDPCRNDSFKTVELFGTRENVAIAEYCFHFLENHLALLWSANRDRFRGVVQTEKNSYFLGLLRGFHQKLREQKKSRTEKTFQPQAGALILAEEQRLAWFVGMRFPRLRRASTRGSKVYGATYQEGVEAGRHITLNDAVTGRKPGFGGLLS